jgi:hypothetical protein
MQTQPEKSLPYGLMMQRRGFNLEWLQEYDDQSLKRDDLVLSEPTPLARKLSHAWNAAVTRWLTAR